MAWAVAAGQLGELQSLTSIRFDKETQQRYGLMELLDCSKQADLGQAVSPFVPLDQMCLLARIRKIIIRLHRHNYASCFQ